MKRKDQSHFGKYARHEVDPPRQQIFADLRSMYMHEYGTSSRETAEFLEISAQSCSTLASGSDKRQPRWCLIFRLLEVLGLELRMTSNSINISRYLSEPEWEEVRKAHNEYLKETYGAWEEEELPPASEEIKELAGKDENLKKLLNGIKEKIEENLGEQ